MPCIFSKICENKNAYQPNLIHKGTFSIILTVKPANDMPTHHFEPTKDLLKTAESATR